MATLIVAENPGKWRRRCDATCHKATSPRCRCICEGRYHGVLLLNRQEQPDNIRRLYVEQPPLFPDAEAACQGC